MSDVRAARGDLGLAETILRGACGERLRTAFPLAPLTTFRLGGPAALYLEPEDDGDLAAASEAVRRAEVPVVVLGKGSNMLVSDEGFPGLVLRLGRGFRWTARERNRLVSGGAMPLPALAGVALRHGLAGLAFGVAIPATVGGAVRMNAGAHGSEMASVVEHVETFGLGTGSAVRIPAADAGFTYRRTALPADAIVTAAVVRLAEGDPAAIRAEMDEARAWRRRTQPLAEPNCGSVFTNPPGDHAARLVQEAGGKQMSVGGARVSAKHANFVIAGPGATAADVLALIRAVRATVRERLGVDLEPEVHLVGRFADA